jgi:hypothetical protein
MGLELAGHVIRLSDDWSIKKVFLREQDGRIRSCKRKLRCLDCIKNDMKLMGAKRWGGKAEERTLWTVRFVCQ